MGHTFSASLTKIDRSRKHLAELETETTAYFATNKAKFVTTVAHIPGTITLSIGFEIPGVPEFIGAIVGDIIHNLRSALDLMACEVVRVAGESDKDVHFPFAKNAEELDVMIRRWRFDRAGRDAVGLLRELKPYVNGNSALRAIHDLDIRDKHQALIPAARSTASLVLQMFDDNGRINPMIMGDSTQASDNYLVFPPDTALDGQRLIPTLHELVQLTDGIVEAFRALANRDSDSIADA